ncbi:MAG: DegV family protein [Lachnospiraceae bacterium]
MSSIAILTDSNSGITQDAAKELGVHVIPMMIIIDGEEYYEGVSLTEEEFFEKQLSGADITTAQPSLGMLIDTWTNLLEKYDEVVYIPMASALSGTYSSAASLSQEEQYQGRVFVVDNKRISVLQKQSVVDALALVQQGMRAEQIKEALEEDGLLASVYLTVDDLKYLVKGGRVTPTAAALGQFLNIRPVLQIQGGLIDAYKKVRGANKAKQVMVDALRTDITERFASYRDTHTLCLFVAHAGALEEAETYQERLREEFPEVEVCRIEPLSLNICTHVGKGAVGIAMTLAKKRS